MPDSYSASEDQGNTLLSEMEKTIPQKVAVCAAHMLLEDGALVLDAGCADGVATAYFALSNPNVHVIGIDYDEHFINVARQKYGHIPNVEFVQDDLRSFDLGDRKLDAIVNLSILHEPYSYTGYRKKTIEEIFTAELRNLKPGGVIINRDFVLPEEQNQMVYLAIRESEYARDDNPDLEKISYSGLLKLYSKEAMAFDNNDPAGHIKGFFLEEHTSRLDLASMGLDEAWRIFYLPHHFAWEFIWRKEYRDRFYPESNEKYGFWSLKNHRDEPQKLGARVSYAAHFENPWILKNWYKPKAALFDRNLKSLPLPPSNFISVIENKCEGESVQLREHRAVESPARYLQLSYFKNKYDGEGFDLVARPGKDVVDVFPYSVKDGELVVYAKHNFPRPLVNSFPRLMTENIDKKLWSGHITEPLAAANIESDWQEAVIEVLRDRAGFSDTQLPRKNEVNSELAYYTAPAELNERVRSTFVKIEGPRVYERKLSSQYSGFSNDGSIRSFTAQSLLNAAQVGMLAEPRLELNTYMLAKSQGISIQPWIADQLPSIHEEILDVKSFEQLQEKAQSCTAYVKTEHPSGWLDIVRSEFHEIVIEDQREKAIQKREREFIVPNISRAGDVTTNSVIVIPLFTEKTSKKIVVGLQKIDESHSQFPSVQERENYSGLMCLPGFRLPKEVEDIQCVPKWLSIQLDVSEESFSRIGEGYFPSLGVMPNRVYPYVTTQFSEQIANTCEFIYLEDLFDKVHDVQDMHLMLCVFRLIHALGLWPHGAVK